MPAVYIPDLAQKLKLIYAYFDLNGRTLMEWMLRTESTLSGWINGTASNEAGCVSDYGRQKLAELLVERLDGYFDLERARALWLGPLVEFKRAFNVPPAARYMNAVEHAVRRTMLSYIPTQPDGTRAIVFFPRQPGYAQHARLGDRFALSVEGATPGAQLFVIAESAIGAHLGVPGPGAVARANPQGRAQMPTAPNAYRFEAPSGLHRILLFEAQANAHLSLVAKSGAVGPLSAFDLDRFAEELSDKTLVKSWSLDLLLIDVV